MAAQKVFVIDLISEKEQGVRLSDIKGEIKEEVVQTSVCRIMALSGQCHRKGCKYAHMSGQLNIRPCKRDCKRAGCPYLHGNETIKSGQDRVFRHLKEKHRSDYIANMRALKRAESEQYAQIQQIIWTLRCEEFLHREKEQNICPDIDIIINDIREKLKFDVPAPDINMSIASDSFPNIFSIS